MNLPGLLLSGNYFESYFEKEVKMDQTNIDPADLNSPCRELSVRGLEIGLHSSFGLRQIDFFVCLYLGSNPAVV